MQQGWQSDHSTSSAAEAARPQAPRGESPRLLPISVATLRPLAQLSFDLYAQRDADGEPALYRQRSYPLTQDNIDRLVAVGMTHLYVTELGRLRYQQYLEEHLEEFLASEATPLDVRCRLLHGVGKSMLGGALRILNVGRAVEVADQLGCQMVRMFAGRELTPIELFHVLRHDPHLLTHLINVAAYGVVLAERLGVTDRTELARVATGALLHDMGLRRVPQSICDKEGVLPPLERDLFERHPQNGYEELHQHRDLQWGQLMMVYQHHERCDGGGYPVRILGAEIHWMARLCAVVDTFDQLTRPRRTRKPAQVEQGMEFLAAGGDQFDKEMVRCWTAAALTPNRSNS